MAKRLTLAAFAAVLLLPSIATADVKAEQKVDDGYAYTFKDDPLAAGVEGAGGTVIKVRPRAARVTLIRPRLSFVQEMFKSVEHL